MNGKSATPPCANGAVRAETTVRGALIGYGEVGQRLAADLAAAGLKDITLWDRLFGDLASAPSQAAKVSPGRACDGLAPALAGRTLIISAVTAGNCLAVAREAAAAIAPQAFYVDMNSVAPRTRRSAAALIEAAGARYIEAAVMSPIAPRGIGSPMLLGGAHAVAFAPIARQIGFEGIEVFAAEIGRASAAKMCRSVMIKGLEALLGESLLAARRYGVEGTVLDSLRNLLPHHDWERLARYMIGRSLRHGVRRAEEMREAAWTVADAGIAPLMSGSCADRQAWAAQHQPADDPTSLTDLLDAVLSQVTPASLERA